MKIIALEHDGKKLLIPFRFTQNDRVNPYAFPKIYTLCLTSSVF
jgi:hypothetical protein